ncbi:hypothetical protein GGH12_003577 [Coemansia sp. RSA 1822]|nr:hypothetical protein IW147_001200 [Coemansia sp. RSA 720]KAJ2561951.1 hypothetical protein GGH12_003577 [Coemansia sp. RSA 1822]
MTLLALSALVVAFCLGIAGVEAGRLISYPPHIRIKPSSYIVEFESHIPKTHVSRFHAMSDVSVDRHFTKVLNGISVSVNKRDFDPNHFAKMDGIKRVWPVRYYYPASSSSSASNSSNIYSHHATGVEKALKELGVDGKGVKIGIVDSGVDYNHPELGACWKTEGCPWQYGKDFIGDKYDMTDAIPIIEPNPTPMDCEGHGTHVSGILAGRGPQVRGVAPGATFGMYRVFSCPVNGQGGSADDILLQGIEAAFEDGHDIISLSLGGGAWSEEPMAVACAQIVQQGVVVVAALGNDGMGGLQTAGAPAIARGVISVGSVDNWNITTKPGIITSTQGTQTIALSMPGNSKYPFDFDSDTPLAIPAGGEDSIAGCANYTEDMTGKIVVVKRGACAFNDKVTYAYTAGAIGVICYNNVAGDMSPGVSNSVPIPFVGISDDDGKYVTDTLAAGKATIKALKGATEIKPSKTGGQISSFSSIGPSAELDMVPLISAPGGNIWSTFPKKLGNYASLSGTSMAAPYISGAVALLKQARPDLDVGAITRLLVSNGKPITDPATGLKTNPFKSGAGLVNIYDAIKSRVQFDPPVLSLNDSKVSPIQGYSKLESLGNVRWAARTINIHNTDSKKSLHLSLNNAAANSLSMFLANGSFSYMPRTWPADTSSVSENELPQVYSPNAEKTIGPGKSCSVTVFIVAPKGLKDSESWYYGGFINFTLQWDGEQTTSTQVVSYGGYNGDSTVRDVLSPPSDGLPAFVDIATGMSVEDLSTLVIGNNVTKAILFGLAIPSRLVEIVLVDAVTSKSAGYTLQGYNEYMPRTCPECSVPYLSAPLTKTVFTNSELTNVTQAPAGKYHVRIRALRPFGDIAVDSDYQVWDSAEFTIA